MITHWSDTQKVSINIDNLHGIIKRFREVFPDNFELSGLVVCPKCEGSGTTVKPGSEITAWIPGDYCHECAGFGVTGIKRIYDEYVCKKCNGRGCDKCDDRGTLDWISKVVKG